jgi:hypothetical protein
MDFLILCIGTVLLTSFLKDWFIEVGVLGGLSLVMLVSRGVSLRNTGRSGVWAIRLVIGMEPMFISITVVIVTMIITIVVTIVCYPFASIVLSQTLLGPFYTGLGCAFWNFSQLGRQINRYMVSLQRGLGKLSGIHVLASQHFDFSHTYIASLYLLQQTLCD